MQNSTQQDSLLNSSQDPILVTGLPGVPGWNIFHGLRGLYGNRIMGQRPVANLKADWDNAIALDSENVQGLESLFASTRFAAVIDASGNCALRACECDPALSRILNYDFAVRIAEQCAHYQIPLMRISSDLVFSGSPGVGGYMEDSPMDPVTIYGKDTADSEIAVTKIKPDVVILRVPLPVGLSPGGHAGAIDWIEWRFRNKRPATLYFDEFRNVISMHDVTRVLSYWLQNPRHFAPGIYHCGGPQELSLYQIGQLINALGGYEPSLLRGCPRIEAGPMPPRAGHVGVNSDKITAILPKGTLRPWPVDPNMFPGDNRNWHYEVDRTQWGGGNVIGTLLMDGVYFCSKS